NGLIREYLPKGCDFRQVSDNEIQDIENKLNNTPSATLINIIERLCRRSIILISVALGVLI
ncbi:hypothetical protein ACQKCX_12390, partial [Psychrobacter pacificensis]